MSAGEGARPPRGGDGPDDGGAGSRPADRCSCSVMRQASRHLTRLYDDALAPTGIGLNQYAILNAVDVGPQSIRTLAERLVYDRSTIGHLLRPLQAKGLLRIERSQGDGRRRVVSLSSAGAALLAAARPHRERAEQGFDDAYGARAAADLRAALVEVTKVRFGR